MSNAKHKQQLLHLAEAITAYANTGSAMWREAVVGIVRDGILTEVETKRLRWALDHAETGS